MMQNEEDIPGQSLNYSRSQSLITSRTQLMDVRSQQGRKKNRIKRFLFPDSLISMKTASTNGESTL